MEPNQNSIEIYQLRVVLRDTSPHIWRRFLVRSDSSIVDLHQTPDCFGDYVLFDTTSFQKEQSGAFMESAAGSVGW